MIEQEQREALLCAIRGGQSLKDAAAAVGIPRSSLYLERSRDPTFAAALAEARLAAKQPEPVVVSQTRSAQLFSDIDLESLTHARRKLLVEFLLAWKELPDHDDSTPHGRMQHAYRAWLKGEHWFDSGLNLDLLRTKSVRAADDYTRWLMVHEAERLANDPDGVTE